MKTKKPSKEQQQIADLTDTLKRVQADFENYKKRTEKQQKEFTKYATAGFVKSLLPIIDNFELAMQHQDNTEEFVKGIKLMHEQLWKVLHQAGIEKIESTGKPFDPEEHEALMAEESDEAENTVLQELFTGYKLKDTVLRPAKVKVAKKKQA